jgi:hypothetical protein
MRRADLLLIPSLLTNITSTVHITLDPMITTPEDWAGFHHHPTQRNGNNFQPRPLSCDPMTMFSDKRTTPIGAHLEEIPNEDQSKSKAGSVGDLLGAFTKAGVSGYETVIVVADATSLPPTSFPVALSHRSLRSMPSRNTLRSSLEHLEEDCDRFELMDEDENDDVKTIEGDRFDDEPMSEHWKAPQSDNMSLCSVLGSVGD